MAKFGEQEGRQFQLEATIREHALAVMNQLFHWVMAECGLSKGPLGHVRTSVNMSERFYASSLSGEMNVGMLHSRR